MTAAEIYQRLVFIGGLDPKYVLDQMDSYEIEIALKGLSFTNRESWEQTRFVAYVMAQINSKEKIKPTEVLHFPWEEGYENITFEEETEEYNEKMNELMEQRAIEKTKENGSGSSNEVMA